jgi:hypothetical protein
MIVALTLDNQVDECRVIVILSAVVVSSGQLLLVTVCRGAIWQLDVFWDLAARNGRMSRVIVSVQRNASTTG